MTILFFVVLILLAMPLWSWLVIRIWTISKPNERATFLLFFPAYFWGYKHWDDRELAIRPLLVANLVVGFITLAIGYKTFEKSVDTLFFGAEYAQEKSRSQVKAKSGVDMVRWCRENNDASYDPLLGTCVEPAKEEAQAQGKSSDVFGRLTQHLARLGIKGEFEQSKMAAAKQTATPEIALGAAFYFLPLSMSQAPITVLLCVSESSCVKFEENEKERGATGMLRNRNLLLLAPAESADDPRIKNLHAAFLRFKS